MITADIIQGAYQSLFGELQFEEERHIYTLRGKILPSVSRKIDGHYAKVDFTPMKRAISKRDNISVDDLQAQWDKKRDDACALGHETHTYAEHYTGRQKPVNKCEVAAKRFLDELPDYYEIVIKEARMFSEEFGYAGTSDLILLDKRTATLVIADYKTNLDLYKHYRQVMKPPFSHFYVNPFNKYKLQLSYYQIMLERLASSLGTTISNRVIVYLQRDGEYKIYPTEDLTLTLKNYMKC